MTDEPTAPSPSGSRRSPTSLALVAVCLLLALVAVVVLIARDESDETATTTTTSRPIARVQPLADWQTELQEGCQRWNRDYEHLEGAEPSTAEEALEHTSDVDALASGLAGTITEAGLPDEQRDEAEQLVELSDQLADAAADLATAAGVADVTGVDDATERIESLGDRINDLTESLQVPACGGY